MGWGVLLLFALLFFCLDTKEAKNQEQPTLYANSDLRL
jgi:hypothetical protein